jgi:hypothetical protein
LYGYSTSNDDGDRITVLGPNKDAMALKRLIAFVPPFDTQQVVRKTSVSISEIVAAGRTIGLGTMDVLAEDPSIATSLVPVLGNDPTLPADLVMGGSTGMVALLRASNARPRGTMRVKRGDDNFLVSAASVGVDDFALLEISADDGTGHVMKWTGNSVADLFDVPPPPSNDLYPANPDAIAIGARSDIGVLRRPSKIRRSFMDRILEATARRFRSRRGRPWRSQPILRVVRSPRCRRPIQLPDGARFCKPHVRGFRSMRQVSPSTTTRPR